jgi:hypothetical protein
MIRRFVLLLVAACGAERPMVAPIGEGSSSRQGSLSRTYRIDTDGRTTFYVGSPHLSIHATTTAATGAITLDVRDLGATRGEVKVDLVTIRSQSNARSDDPISMGARTCLELAVGDRIDEKMRWAVFRVASIDELEPSRDALTIPPLSGGGDVRRSVTFTAHGDLLVHGRAVPKTVRLRAELAWPREGDRDAPRSIAIQTIEPVEVRFAEHAINPRDAARVWETQIGDTANVGIDFTAR